MNNWDYFTNQVHQGIKDDLTTVACVLDEIYQKDKKNYDLRISLLKECGFRVFRNEEGKHLIKRKVKEYLNEND